MTENTTANGKHGFWEFKKYQEHEWFRFLVKLLICTIALYLVSHLLVRQFDPNAGYEYETLGKEELLHINRIYFDSVVTAAPTAEENGDADAMVDAVAEDTITAPAGPATGMLPAVRNDRAIEFVRNHFNYKVDSLQLVQIHKYLKEATALEAVSFWGSVRLRLRSYFWLVGPEIYFEIIFWTLLGVIASLLFSLGVVSRNRTTDPQNAQTTFDSSEIPYQFAKLWYAPIITLVIVLGYNFFQDDNIADISSSKGVIVFAFIGGFYSARLIAFLDRLKEVLLPVSSTAELPVQKATVPVLEQIKVDLQVDPENLTPELAAEIAEIGLANATVTLENDENGEIIKAEESGEDQSTSFLAANIKPGTYTIRASWSGDVNEQPVNLAGEEKAAIRNADAAITVVLRKDETEG